MAILLIVLICLISGLSVCLAVFRSRDKKVKYYHQGKAVFVKNGVGVKEQRLEAYKNKIFIGNLAETDTKMTYHPSENIWWISFREIKFGNVTTLSFSKEMWIGRMDGESGEVRLELANDRKVSNEHCMIYETQNGLWIKDMHSLNGTFVNGKKIDLPLPLHNGDIVKVGRTYLQIDYGKLMMERR